MKKRDGIKYRGQGRKSVDKHQLLDEYYRLKKALGRKPICSEYLSATKIKLKTLSALFGKPGWLNLVKEAGDNRTNRGRRVAHKPDAVRRRQLLDSYTDLKKDLGRQPSLAEYSKNVGCINRELDNAFGRPGWKNMLKEAGDRPRQGRRKELTLDHLMSDYAALRNRLNRMPTYREFYGTTGHGDKTLAMYFGRPGWSSLVQAAGDKPRRSDEDDKARKRELVSSYLSLKKRLGRQPTTKEFYQETKHTLFMVNRLFGRQGWRKLLRHVGDKIVNGGRPRLGRQHLLDHYSKLKEELGRRPSYAEYVDHSKHHVGSLVLHFGRPGWHNLIKAAGDKPGITS